MAIKKGVNHSNNGPWSRMSKTSHLKLKCEVSRTEKKGLSAGTGKLCIFGHLGLVFIWSCFVSCLLLLLYYVICAPVLTEGTEKKGSRVRLCFRVVDDVPEKKGMDL